MMKRTITEEQLRNIIRESLFNYFNGKGRYANGEEELAFADGGGFVDLGLPSGTKWANCNVGALNPEEVGDALDWEDAMESGELPSVKQFQELFNVCDFKWTMIGNRRGFYFIGPNGNSIFLPCTGAYQGNIYLGAETTGCYWTKDEDKRFQRGRDYTNACYAIFLQKTFKSMTGKKNYEQSARLVSR